jgi:hypothetical protein
VAAGTTFVPPGTASVSTGKTHVPDNWKCFKTIAIGNRQLFPFVSLRAFYRIVNAFAAKNKKKKTFVYLRG